MLLRWSSTLLLRRLIVSNPLSQFFCKFLSMSLSTLSLNIGIQCRPLYTIPGFTVPAHAPSTGQPNALPLPPPPAAAPFLSDAQLQSLVQDLMALSLHLRMDQGVPLLSHPSYPVPPPSPTPPLPSPPSSEGGWSSLGHTQRGQHCHLLNPCHRHSRST